MSPDQILDEAAEMFRQKNAEYRNSYRSFGYILREMFPGGIHLTSVDDYNRFAIFVIMMAKMHRYALNFGKPHRDSIRDIIVYAAMLEDLHENDHR